MKNSLVGKRVLVVHAHPDDEVLFTGGIIAELTDNGADVLLLTATLGRKARSLANAIKPLKVVTCLAASVFANSKTQLVPSVRAANV